LHEESAGGEVVVFSCDGAFLWRFIFTRTAEAFGSRVLFHVPNQVRMEKGTDQVTRSPEFVLFQASLLPVTYLFPRISNRD
jgi:hypothetical protein